jgi:hypothetical protein
MKLSKQEVEHFAGVGLSEQLKLTLDNIFLEDLDTELRD